MGEAGAGADVEAEADVGVDAGAGVRISAVVMRQPSGVRVHSRRDAASESEAVSAEQGGWGNAKRNAKREGKREREGMQTAGKARDGCGCVCECGYGCGCGCVDFMVIGNFWVRRRAEEGWYVSGLVVFGSDF
jgi:hypothetical protein